MFQFPHVRVRLMKIAKAQIDCCQMQTSAFRLADCQTEVGDSTWVTKWYLPESPGHHILSPSTADRSTHERDFAGNWIRLRRSTQIQGVPRGGSETSQCRFTRSSKGAQD